VDDRLKAKAFHIVIGKECVCVKTSDFDNSDHNLPSKEFNTILIPKWHMDQLEERKSNL
jgi:hypothetical protein